MKGSKERQRLGKLGAYAVLVIMGTASVLPILFIVVASFKPQAAFVGTPPFAPFSPTLEHYRELLADPTVFRSLLNSAIATGASTVGSVTLATLGAYALARLRPRGHRGIALATVGVRMLPPVAMIVPLYLVADDLGILDTHWILILPYMALSIPLAVWMMHGFFIDLPKELEEAAFIDGCTRMGAFVRIILPLAAPGIAAVSIFSFTLAWNDLLIALALTSFDATTLPVLGSRLRGEEGIDWGGLGALTTVIMVPAVIFTLVMRKHLVSGLAGAAGRG